MRRQARLVEVTSRWRAAMTLALALTLALVAASVASAAPVLEIASAANTTAAPGGTLSYFVNVTNVGDIATSGDLTLRVTLPQGLTASSSDPTSAWDCSSLVVGASTVTCTLPELLDPRSGGPSGVFSRTLTITASVDPSATGTLTSTFDVTGGGADPVSTVDPTRISATVPGFGIDAFDGQVTANAAGAPFTQAGGHPFAASTTILFNTLTNPNPLLGSTWPVEPTKDVFVDLPPGFIGNPTATGNALCTQVQLANSQGIEAKPLCPTGSQIGVASVLSSNGTTLGDPLPVFNVVPPPSVPARFGFNVAGSVVLLDGSVRSGGDYGLSVDVKDVPQGLGISGTSLTFWGIPADPSHDAERSCPGQLAPWEGGPACTTEAPRTAFLRNPTSCTAPGIGLATNLRVDSWTHPGDFQTASFTTHLPPAYPLAPSGWGAPQGPTGCDLVPFAPTLAGSPATGEAAAPSGFSFDLTLPQNEDPDEIGTSDLKSAVVTLPAGLRVSPSSAAGLGACSPAQIQLSSDADPTCPGSSKIGTVTIDTPLLSDPLQGSIYLGTPHDNPFGTLLSLYLVARGPGVVVKLPGRISPDASTGQLSASFDNQPQLPFSKLHLEFTGGERAPLSNPPACGTYTTHAVLSSWSGASVPSDSSFTVSRDGYGSPCGAPQFAPVLQAGVDQLGAGKHSTFRLRLSRSDSDQELRTLTVRMPRGLLAKVAGVPLCPSAQAAAGTCGESSRIGSVLTGAGAGSEPFYLPGRAYLTGPYKGGPFGLSIVVPAIAGPFNLGNVVVRTSIQLDVHTAQLRVVSDPLPTIIQGIPLQIRDIRVTIDRSRFLVNPTNCDPERVAATVGSTQGKVANLSDRFQVSGCAKLPLRPKLTLAVGGKGHTGRHASTPFSTTLTQTPGQASLKSVSVSLPSTLNARLDVVNNACTQAQFDAGHCAKARTGSAVAVTPLLAHPLRGSVYFVKDPAKPVGSLPNLVVALRGQVSFDLIGKVTIPGGIRLATKFAAVPDVPITSFTLRLVAGGKHGALGVADNLCTAKAKRATASVVMTGQNGLVISRSQRLGVRGCKRGR